MLQYKVSKISNDFRQLNQEETVISQQNNRQRPTVVLLLYNKIVYEF